MALRISHNIEAFRAYRNLDNSATAADSSQTKTQNTLAERAATIRDNVQLQSQINGVAFAQRNAQEAQSLLQIGSRTLGTVESYLQQTKALADQVNTSPDMYALQEEAGSIHAQIQRLVSNAHANGIPLFTGNGSIPFQIGAEAENAVQVATVKLVGGPEALIDESLFDLEDGSLASIDTALSNVRRQANAYQATQERLHQLTTGLDVLEENWAASLSSLASLNEAHALVQEATASLNSDENAVLSHAELTPEQVVRLLS